jgi:hypothetical protein
LKSRFIFGSADIDPAAILAVEGGDTAMLTTGTKRTEIILARKDNHEKLEEIVNQIDGLLNENYRVRVVLIGHANEIPIKVKSQEQRPFLSNYELAEARAKNIQLEIQHKLSTKGTHKWYEIDWVYLSKSNEPEPTTAKDIEEHGREKPEYTKPKLTRSVDVSIEPAFPKLDIPKSLKLIDYIYFANYTITTTGYGDIIPTTDYAKFLCSVTNICEVFFLVVFFNALLSLKGDKEGKKDKFGALESLPPELPKRNNGAGNQMDIEIRDELKIQGQQPEKQAGGI